MTLNKVLQNPGLLTWRPDRVTLGDGRESFGCEVGAFSTASAGFGGAGMVPCLLLY